MIVNLNVMCKVELNDFGKVIWLSQIDDLSEEVKQNNPEIVESIKNKIDAHGCIELELWGIMNVFGRYISPVKSPFVSTTIELHKNPDFESWKLK